MLLCKPVSLSKKMISLNALIDLLGYSEQVSACEKLTQLRVWTEQQLPGGLIAFNLNANFRENFQKALLA